MKDETAECPDCGEPNAILLDNVAPSQTKFDCEDCGQSLVAQRLHVGGLKVKSDDGVPKRGRADHSRRRPITEEFLNQVELLLPVQPWPTGVHKEVAEKLETSPSHVSRAIDQLIKSGRVHNQIDGKVYNETVPNLDQPN